MGKGALNLKMEKQDSIKVSANGEVSRMGNHMAGIFYPLRILLNAMSLILRS